MKYLICLCLLALFGCSTIGSTSKPAAPALTQEQILAKARREIRELKIEVFWQQYGEILRKSALKETGLGISFTKEEAVFIDKDNMAMIHIRVSLDAKTIAHLYMVLAYVSDEWELRSVIPRREPTIEE